ncbi:MAG: polysaccharide deacetylase family protein [Candidatus Latescibacterota bacterium]|nr:MAG: polysaccharide deacetylase family protein [Candidatus Latescibacterota bacterium]
MYVLLAVVAVLSLLYLTWKVRYRYPPVDAPQALCYHKLSERFCFEGTWTTPNRFLGQIDYLIGAGFSFIGEAEFLAALDDPSAGSSKRLLLTFDDGYEELYDMYLDHLVPRGIPILVFLVVGYVGRENTWDLSMGRRSFRHLDWRQIEEMAKKGADFGSHGFSHTDLKTAGAEILDREIARSREIISERIGTPIRSFSYPFGRYTSTIKTTVEAAGYSAAFSLYPRHRNEHIDRFALRRNGVYFIDTPMTINWKLERSRFFWFEEMKCRTINNVAALTPLLKRFSSGPGK